MDLGSSRKRLHEAVADVEGDIREGDLDRDNYAESEISR